MAIARGERFFLDLKSDEDEASPQRNTPLAFNFVGDIKERAPTAPKAPTAPTLKNASGFPAHRVRSRGSAFERQRSKATAPSEKDEPPMTTLQSHSRTGQNETMEERERREIDTENRQRIEAMSPEEIEEERKELFAGLNPSLIEKLLKRATIDDAPQTFSDSTSRAGETQVASQDRSQDIASDSKDLPIVEKDKSKSSKSVSFAETTTLEAKEDSEPEAEDTQNSVSLPDVPPPSSIHFPRPPQPPDLDPNDPSFLTSLHEKYFPSLAYDPSSLTWMTPANDATSTYSPSQTDLSVSALRFSFKGALIPPTKALQIPVTEGLHHHGDAPSSAGYTIPELAHLARSTVAAQRCVAYQTLGRFLYRLGKGEFGTEGGRRQYNVTVVDAEGGEIREEVDAEEDDRAGLVSGLWDMVEKERVIEILTEEANKETGHASARSYAVEAVWCWQRGGGRRRRAV